MSHLCELDVDDRLARGKTAKVSSQCRVVAMDAQDWSGLRVERIHVVHPILLAIGAGELVATDAAGFVGGKGSGAYDTGL